MFEFIAHAEENTFVMSQKVFAADFVSLAFSCEHEFFAVDVS